MHIHHHYYIYLLTNKNNTVLYTGVTSDLKSRIWQHKTKHYPKSFSYPSGLRLLLRLLLRLRLA
ncbi:MAG: GIY-YIG nuclease family protein [Lewinellaceae bacterium]|nr:GIY-YIG nuclease family protein [Lewinellaceae bacterium]